MKVYLKYALRIGRQIHNPDPKGLEVDEKTGNALLKARLAKSIDQIKKEQKENRKKSK